MAQAKKASKHNTRNKASKKYVKKSNLRKTKKSIKRRTYRKRTIKGGADFNSIKKFIIERLLSVYPMINKLTYKSKINDIKYRLIRYIKQQKGCDHKGIYGNKILGDNDTNLKANEEMDKFIKKDLSNKALLNDCTQLDELKEEVKKNMGDFNKFKRFRIRHTEGFLTNPIVLSHLLNFLMDENNNLMDENNLMTEEMKKHLKKLILFNFFATTNNISDINESTKILVDKMIEMLNKFDNGHEINDKKYHEINKNSKNTVEELERKVETRNVPVKYGENIKEKYNSFKLMINNFGGVIEENSYLSFEEFNYLMNIYYSNNVVKEVAGGGLDYRSNGWLCSSEEIYNAAGMIGAIMMVIGGAILGVGGIDISSIALIVGIILLAVGGCLFIFSQSPYPIGCWDGR